MSEKKEVTPNRIFLRARGKRVADLSLVIWLHENQAASRMIAQIKPLNFRAIATSGAADTLS